MPFGSSFRGARSLLVAAVTATVGVTLITPPAQAANPVTPGNFRGLGFDQCNAPSQAAMSTWIAKSPFRAAGIYISGNSRACRAQKNLTATWVQNQLAAGWHLMPITLGPQAACSTRYPRYGASIDPKISASTTNTYAAARSQGATEAARAVNAARALGIVPGSTLFYDLEAFDTRKSAACTWSAKWFLHAWTDSLHAYGYASGFYSSAASGIRMLDDARVTAGNPIHLPDQIWIADWNGKANTSSTYIRSDGWLPYRRAHQYQGGHNETWGGVTINIDRNYLDLRTPSLPGSTTPGSTPSGPAPTPPTASTPRYTGSSMADARCTTGTINKASYRTTSASRRADLVVPLQCLLKQQRLYPYEVTGSWNAQTLSGSRSFQKRVGHPVRSYFTRRDWVSLLTAGNSGTVLKLGSRGAEVTQVQRAMNAATGLGIPIHGRYNTRTRGAVRTYQRHVHVRASGVVASQTWSALAAGRR